MMWDALLIRILHGARRSRMVLSARGWSAEARFGLECRGVNRYRAPERITSTFDLTSIAIGIRRRIVNIVGWFRLSVNIDGLAR